MEYPIGEPSNNDFDDLKGVFGNGPGNLIEEACNYLDHSNPERTFIRLQRVENAKKAVGGAVLFGLSFWMISRGAHSPYQQVVDGFSGMH